MARQSGLVARVCHAALQTPDLEASLGHAREVLGLVESGREGDTVFLTCGRRDHDLELIAGDRVGLHHVALEAHDAEALAEIARRAEARGGLVTPRPSPEPGLGNALRLLAPGGHVVEVHDGMAAADLASLPDSTASVRPVKLGHVTLTAPDRAEASRSSSSTSSTSSPPTASAPMWSGCAATTTITGSRSSAAPTRASGISPGSCRRRET